MAKASASAQKQASGHRGQRLLLYLAAAAACVYSFWPIVTMGLEGYNIDLGAIFSGKAFREVAGLPVAGGLYPTAYYYLQALGKQSYPRLVADTLGIAALSIAIALVVGLPVAYMLARIDVKGKTFVSYLLLAVRTISQFVVVVPLYIAYSELGLYDSFTGIALAEQILILSVVVWMLRGFFSDIPKEIYDAASVYGKSEWQVFRRVVFPMVIPGVVVVTLFALVLIWNDFLLADSLTGTATKTVAVGVWEGLSISQLAIGAQSWDSLNAAGTLAYLPAMAVMLLIRRYLAKGFSLGMAH